MRARSIIVPIFGLSLAACAAGPAPRTGFLDNYSGLAKVGKSDSLIEQRPPADFDPRAFHAVAIDATVVHVDKLSEEDRTKLAAVFREALVEQLKGELPVVDRAGPGVLRVRTAIVGARRANVPVNVITGILGAPISPTMGGVAAEAEVLDGGTGRRIAALSWARRGAKMKEIGLTYTRLGEARSGLRAFAKRLAGLFAPQLDSPRGEKRDRRGERS